MSPPSLLFSTIEVTKQVFYRSSLSFAIVNLKPIVPGHVLVVPSRPVARLSELKGDELSCLMQSVQSVGSVVERAYNADALTFACQVSSKLDNGNQVENFDIIFYRMEGQLGRAFLMSISI
jgi:bis(5'-adenosyl)-triphosphatase